MSDIPTGQQSLKDILSERFTLRDLIIKDKIANERKSLKDIILEMEDEVLANAGVDVFEEVFKLIFTKLYDEYLSQPDKGIINYFLRQVIRTVIHDPAADYAKTPAYLDGRDYDAFKPAVQGVSNETFRVMEFRNSGQTDTELEEQDSRSVQSSQGAVERRVPRQLGLRTFGQPSGRVRRQSPGREAVQFQPARAYSDHIVLYPAWVK